MSKTDNYTFLTTAPIRRVIPTMAVPTIISMMVTSIYNLVDTYFVGLINTQATAAVGVAFPLMSVLQAIGFFFGQGAGTYMSRQLGARNRDAATQMAATSLVASIVCGIVITVLGLIFLRPLALLMGSTPTILPYAMQYIGVILLGAPIMTASMVINNQMRFQGNASEAMYGMISGAVLNVVLVPLFMFTFDMGILGTAIGTVLSQLFGLIVLIWMSRRGASIRIHLRHTSTDRHYYREIIRGGTPSLTRQALGSIATLMLNVAAGAYGDEAIAGMSIVTRLAWLLFAIIIGIGQGYQPFCGFNYGAGLYRRLLRGFYFTVLLNLAVVAVLCGPAMYFAEELVQFLRDDPKVIPIGAVALRWQLATMALASIITAANMTLQTTGHAVPANVLAAARNGIFFMPLIIILPHWLGLYGVEICQAVSDVLSCLLAVPLITGFFRKILKSSDIKD